MISICKHFIRQQKRQQVGNITCGDEAEKRSTTKHQGLMFNYVVTIKTRSGSKTEHTREKRCRTA